MVGMTVWETTHIPPHWRELLESMDSLMVPSEFTRRILMNDGVTRPVAVIPHISPPRQPPRAVEEMEAFCQREKIEADRYVFYTINTWTARKAVWNTLRAYLQAFTSRDPVLLVVKTNLFGPRDYSARCETDTEIMVSEIVAEFPHSAPVRCIRRNLTAGEMQCLHQRGDCYFSLTHSEGWGLGAFEAAARGKPVIITGWGGQLEYLPPDAAFLLDHRLIAVEDWLGRGSYQSSQQWARPDMDHAIAWLRWVHAHPREAREKAAPLIDYVRQRFNPSVVTDKILQAMEG
jgi:glycosyltransferase involved in cell wall biosynthesis